MPSDDEQPQLYLMDGTDELYLEEEGKAFHPGDRMPRTLSNAKRASLQAAGVRFETRHPEPPSEPAPKPSGRASAEPAPAAGSAETPPAAAKE